jgi:hypothetical protein
VLVEVPVEAVERRVELPPHEPLAMGRIELTDDVPSLEPGEALGLGLPPGIGIFSGLLVHGGIVEVRPLGESFGCLERAALLKECFDSPLDLFLDHLRSPFQVRDRRTDRG